MPASMHGREINLANQRRAWGVRKWTSAAGEKTDDRGREEDRGLGKRSSRAGEIDVNYGIAGNGAVGREREVEVEVTHWRRDDGDVGEGDGLIGHDLAAKQVVEMFFGSVGGKIELNKGFEGA